MRFRIRQILRGMAAIFARPACLPKRSRLPDPELRRLVVRVAELSRADRIAARNARRLAVLLLILVAGCADPVPVVLPPGPTPTPQPWPDPDPSPLPDPGPAPAPIVSDGWAKAEALSDRVRSGERVHVDEITATFGEGIPRHTRPDGMQVVTWRVADSTGANILNVHVAVDPATGVAVGVENR